MTLDTTQIPLTEDMVTRHIATLQAIKEFWGTHKALQDSAAPHAHHYVIASTPPGSTVPVRQQPTLPVGVYDYGALIPKEPALADIFKKNKLTPQEFEQIHLTVTKAIRDLEIKRAVLAGNAAQHGAVARLLGPALSDSTSVASKNMAVVEPHRQELAALGLVLAMDPVMVTP